VASVAGAATTNGQEVTFGKVHCATNIALSQDLDVSVQAVVPNNVGLGASYSATIPGGTATIPSNASGQTILSYSNLGQTYIFRSSTGNPTITAATPASSTAHNDGAQPFSTAVYSSANGGTITYSTQGGASPAPTLLSPGDHVTITGASPGGYNLTDAVVATTPTTTSFTVTGTGADPTALVTPGIINSSLDVPYSVTHTNVGAPVTITASAFNNASNNAKGTLDYTTSAPHNLVAGEVVDITGETPAGYNQNAAFVAATPAPTATTFSIAASPTNATTLASASYKSGDSAIQYTTSANHGLANFNIVTITGFSNPLYNFTNASITVTGLKTFEIGVGSNPGSSGTVGTLLSPNPGASTVQGSANTLASVRLNTTSANPGSLTTPDTTISLTAPNANATVTTYTAGITTGTVIKTLGAVNVVCAIPHSNPQTDGISATVVGSGGPTTTSQPQCRPVTATCDTTTTLSTTSTTSTTTTSTTTTSTTTTSTTTTSTTSTTSTSVPPSTTSSTEGGTTSTTTGPPPGPMTCGMGAGIPQTPPKPPKNSGLVKISKGLTNTPAVKDTKLTVSGTLDGCTGFDSIPTKYGTPITSGAVKLTLEISPGSTCAGLTSGFPVKSSLSITWNAINPAKNKAAKVYSEKTTLASYMSIVGTNIEVDISSQAFGPKSKTPGFQTKHADMVFNIDESTAAIATPCGTTDGVKALHFTAVNGPSTLTVN
jgi:hypothetical protein